MTGLDETRKQLFDVTRERERAAGKYNVRCPRCKAETGEPCVGTVRQGSTLHASRVDRWLAMRGREDTKWMSEKTY